MGESKLIATEATLKLNFNSELIKMALYSHFSCRNQLIQPAILT